MRECYPPKSAYEAMRALLCEIRRFKRALGKELRLVERLDWLEVKMLQLEHRVGSRALLSAAIAVGVVLGAVLYCTTH